MTTQSSEREGKRLCIDLFCGLGGWAEGFLSEGYWVVGFDIERHDYGTGAYPGDFVMQDVLTLHGKQFKDAAVIVASPPCQAYSYRAMPWNPVWAQQSGMDDDGAPPIDHRVPDPIFNTLFGACFRIQREACEATGRHIPLIVENVCGAQRWVGRAGWHFGSYYLWGDIPALMPMTRGIKNGGGSWFAITNNTLSGHSQNPDGRKLKGNNSPRMWADRRIQRLCDANRTSTDDFYMAPSSSSRRKRASAEIAKIPFPLAQHIAKVFKERGDHD